ncbi:hypothetical protein SAMN02745172_02791 [Pseudoxanthobacter soli DSM 19599]|uniref:Uncharacterized protein n=1 Tax=Pseudoxanthobacter soli DSM 19599 TaxID=1123029 RepID=A0A1M7ZN98_9HYPH|nr:hypothetical protein SAMN02745172_02791 [Pseudoxanthobacter soli DSM 19599]
MRSQGTPLPQPAVQTDATPGCRHPGGRRSPDRPAHPPEAIQPAPPPWPPASSRGTHASTPAPPKAERSGCLLTHAVRVRKPAVAACPFVRAPLYAHLYKDTTPQAAWGANPDRAPHPAPDPVRGFLSRQPVVDWNRSKHKNDLQSPSADAMVRSMGYRAESAASFHAIRSPGPPAGPAGWWQQRIERRNRRRVADRRSSRGAGLPAPSRNGDLD